MASLPENTDTLEAADGIRIFYRHYPADAERGRLVIAHGLGEHSGRYINILDCLLPLGFSIWLPDHRGHGKSGGKRGHIQDFRQYLFDLHAMVELARRDITRNQKTLLLGHSLGGLIALYYAQQYPEHVDGIVVSSPALGMIVAIPPLKKMLATLMSRLWPGLSLSNELNSGKISHDPDVVSAYENDPLVHDRVSARFFNELIGAMETVNRQTDLIQVPILMQLAGNDHLVDAESAECFYRRLKAPDRTLRIYPGFYHEIYNETQDRRNTALNDLRAWLVERAWGMDNDD